MFTQIVSLSSLKIINCNTFNFYLCGIFNNEDYESSFMKIWMSILIQAIAMNKPGATPPRDDMRMKPWKEPDLKQILSFSGCQIFSIQVKLNTEARVRRSSK